MLVIFSQSLGLSWNMKLFVPMYIARMTKSCSIESWQKMRISLADSRTNGFKKWSDAQHQAEQPAPKMPEPRTRHGELMRPDAGIVSDRT
jgi:hypothetical protein